MQNVRPRKLTEIFAILWRRKLVILLVTAPMLKAAFMVINTLPALYESQAQVVIQGGKEEDVGPQVAAAQQELLSQANLEALVRRNGLLSAGDNPAAVAERLHREIKIETVMRTYYPNGPESMKLRWRHNDPQVAQRVLADLLTGFELANERYRDQATATNEKMKTELAEMEGTLRELSQQRANAAAIQTSATTRQNTDNKVPRATLIAAIDALNNRQFMLERQINDQTRQISEQQKIVRAATTGNRARESSSYGVLLVRKAELEATLRNYLTQYTDRNPKVIQTKTEIAEINRQLALLDQGDEAGKTEALSPEARELRTMQRELARLQTELDVTRHDLSQKQEQLAATPETDPQQNLTSVAEASRTATEVENEYNRLMTKYQRLQEQQAQLKERSGLSDGNVSLFRVTSPPGLSQTPVAPNRNLLRLLAAALSLGAGLLLAVALEVRRWFVIRDERDVEYFLGVPVMGLIPETLTPVEQGFQRRQMLVRSLVWVGVAIVAIPVLSFLLARIQIFQLLANR